MKKHFHTLAGFGLFLSSLLCCFAAQAQPVASSEALFDLHFLKDSIEVEEGTFAFNNLSIRYTGGGGTDADLKLAASNAIHLVSASTTRLQLHPGGLYVQPIRFAIAAPTPQWTPFVITIHLIATGQQVERTFWVRQKAFTRWRCTLQEPLILLQGTLSATDFFVRIENTGSEDDEYTFTAEGDLKLETPKKDRHLTVVAGGWGRVKLTVKPKPEQAAAQTLALSVYIQNKNGEKRLVVQKFTFIRHSYNEGVYRWQKMPLSLEVSAQNVGTSYTSYAASVNGTLGLSNGRSASVNARINYLPGGNLAHTNLYQLAYASPGWTVAGGSFVDFTHFLLNGYGIRINKNDKGGSGLQLTALKGRLENTRQADLSASQVFSKRLSAVHNSFINLDYDRGEKSYLTVNRLSLSLKNTTIGITGGVGGERKQYNKTDTVTGGAMGGYQLETVQKKWSLYSQLDWYSRYFPGVNRGFQYHQHELRFQLPKTSFAAFYRANRKVVISPTDSMFKALIYTDEKEYGLRNSITLPGFYLTTSAGILEQQQDSVESAVSRMWKLSLNINWSISTNWSASVFSNAGTVSLPSLPQQKPVNAFTNFGSIQNRNVGVYFRYDKGPFYYFEIKEYLKQQQAFERIQISPFVQHTFTGANLFTQLQLTYSKEQALSNQYLLLTHQFNYTSTKWGLDAGLFGTIDLRHQREPVLNFTLRKRLLAPIYPAAQSYSFTLVLFKDKNGNNLPDADEEPVSNALILTNNNWLSTNNKGELELRNLSAAPVQLDFSKISQLAGWIPGGGFLQQLKPIKGSKKVYVPFKASRTVDGTLALLADEKSNQSMEMSNIRVTATDEAGKTYNTLTDNNGHFQLNLPAGQYIVSLNENVFDENFKPVESSLVADLVNNQGVRLNFSIRQKRRVINVRKGE